MKEKENMYILIQKAHNNTFEEERLYKFIGGIIKEYRDGEFYKVNKFAVIVFTKEATSAAVYLNGEYRIKQIGCWYSLSKDGKRANYDQFYNLRNEKKKEEFLDFIN